MPNLVLVWPCEYCGRELDSMAKELKPGARFAPANLCPDCNKLTSLNWFAWSWQAKSRIESNFGVDELNEFRKDPKSYVREKINPDLIKMKLKRIVITRKDGHIALITTEENSGLDVGNKAD